MDEAINFVVAIFWACVCFSLAIRSMIPHHLVIQPGRGKQLMLITLILLASKIFFNISASTPIADILVTSIFLLIFLILLINSRLHVLPKPKNWRRTESYYFNQTPEIMERALTESLQRLGVQYRQEGTMFSLEGSTSKLRVRQTEETWKITVWNPETFLSMKDILSDLRIGAASHPATRMPDFAIAMFITGAIIIFLLVHWYQNIVSNTIG